MLKLAKEKPYLPSECESSDFLAFFGNGLDGASLLGFKSEDKFTLSSCGETETGKNFSLGKERKMA